MQSFRQQELLVLKGLPYFSKTKIQLMHQTMNRLCRDGKIRIIYGIWRECVAETIEDVEEWNIQKGLELYSNNEPNILVQLQSIKFPYLKELNLYDNQIESLESIARLNIPELRHLNLDGNHITCLRSLRKNKFSNLQLLHISGKVSQHNLIKSICPLIQLQLSKSFYILGYENNAHGIKNCNIKYVIKLQHSPKVLLMKNQRQIRQEKFIKFLQERKFIQIISQPIITN